MCVYGLCCIFYSYLLAYVHVHPGRGIPPQNWQKSFVNFFSLDKVFIRIRNSGSKRGRCCTMRKNKLHLTWHTVMSPPSRPDAVSKVGQEHRCCAFTWTSSAHSLSSTESSLIRLSVCRASALLMSVRALSASHLHVAGFPGLPGGAAPALTPCDLLSSMFRCTACVSVWVCGRDTKRERVEVY